MKLLFGSGDESRWTLPLLCIICGLAGAVYALYLGYDSNFDQFNYHLYSAYALVHWRYSVDIQAGGIGGFLNPTIYIPVYVLLAYFPPWLESACIGFIHGLNVVLAFLILRSVAPRNESRWSLFGALALSIGSPVFLGEIGTSLADILTSLLVLGALVILLSLKRELTARRALVAGLLLGAAVGLKLTNLIYIFGIAGALIAGRYRLMQIAWTAAGGIIGGLITGGWWAILMWQRFGSPLFPFYNTFFRSPNAPLSNISDDSLLPRSIIDGLMYPFYMMIGTHRTTEVASRDARFAFALIIIAMVTATFFLKLSRPYVIREKIYRNQSTLFVFFLITYAVWLLKFSVQRYAIVLDLIIGPIVFILCVKLLGCRIRNYFIALLACACLVWMRPANWGRLPWSEAFNGSTVSVQFPQPAHYYFFGDRESFLSLYLNPGSVFIRMDNHAFKTALTNSFGRRLQQLLEGPPLSGGDWAIRGHGSDASFDSLKEFGLVAGSLPCRIISGPSLTFDACPLRRADAR